MWVRVKSQIRIPEKGMWAHNNINLLHSCLPAMNLLKPRAEENDRIFYLGQCKARQHHSTPTHNIVGLLMRYILVIPIHFVPVEAALAPWINLLAGANFFHMHLIFCSLNLLSQNVNLLFQSLSGWCRQNSNEGLISNFHQQWFSFCN